MRSFCQRGFVSYIMGHYCFVFSFSFTIISRAFYDLFHNQMTMSDVVVAFLTSDEWRSDRKYLYRKDFWEVITTSVSFASFLTLFRRLPKRFNFEITLHWILWISFFFFRYIFCLFAFCSFTILNRIINMPIKKRIFHHSIWFHFLLIFFFLISIKWSI